MSRPGNKTERIEADFGFPLVWDTKEGRRACGIRKTFTTGGYRDEEAWEAMYEELALAMARLESAMTPHLQGL